jgi:hypothetical protein
VWGKAVALPRYRAYDFVRQTTIFYDFVRLMIALVHEAYPPLDCVISQNGPYRGFACEANLAQTAADVPLLPLSRHTKEERSKPEDIFS